MYKEVRMKVKCLSKSVLLHSSHPAMPIKITQVNKHEQMTLGPSCLALISPWCAKSTKLREKYCNKMSKFPFVNTSICNLPSVCKPLASYYNNVSVTFTYCESEKKILRGITVINHQKPPHFLKDITWNYSLLWIIEEKQNQPNKKIFK